MMMSIWMPYSRYSVFTKLSCSPNLLSHVFHWLTNPSIPSQVSQASITFSAKSKVPGCSVCRFTVTVPMHKMNRSNERNGSLVDIHSGGKWFSYASGAVDGAGAIVVQELHHISEHLKNVPVYQESKRCC